MRTLLLSSLMLLLAACSSNKSSSNDAPTPVNDNVAKAIPAEYRDLLEDPEGFELLTVACGDEELPEGADGSLIWSDYVQVDSRKITDVPTRQALVTALYTAISRQEDRAAACFEPHHGIRVTAGEVSVTILVCFICHNFHMRPEGGNRGMYIDVGAMKGWREEVQRLGMLQVAKTRMTGDPP